MRLVTWHCVTVLHRQQRSEVWNACRFWALLTGYRWPAGAVAQIATRGRRLLLKFRREYETEADILGAQILARAGYDPRDLAAMFQTIERQGGGSSGGFLSSHPSPQNRYARINQEAQYLRVQNPNRDTGDFARIQARLQGYGAAPSMAEIARSGQRYPAEGGGDYPQDAPGGRVDYPSTRYRSYNEFGFLTVSVPDNWRKLGNNNALVFPEGGYGQYQNQAVFTHGVNFGVSERRVAIYNSNQELINSWRRKCGLRQSTSFRRLLCRVARA